MGFAPSSARWRQSPLLLILIHNFLVFPSSVFGRRFLVAFEVPKAAVNPVPISDLASRTLLPVLLGEISAEKALRSSLRSHYNFVRRDGCDGLSEDGRTAPETECLGHAPSRALYRDLVLGVSVLRLRYAALAGLPAGTVPDTAAALRMVDLHRTHLLDPERTSAAWRPALPGHAYYSLPPALYRALERSVPTDTLVPTLEASCRPGPVTLRPNALRCSADSLLARLAEEGAEVRPAPPVRGRRGDSGRPIRLPDGAAGPAVALVPSPSGPSVWSLPAWRDGWFEVQDAGSQAIARSLEISGEDRTVLDYCAGNGGKALAVASAMTGAGCAGGGAVACHDIDGRRLAQIRGSLARAGAVPPTGGACGAVRIGTAAGGPAAAAGLLEELVGKVTADAVLVDAPCSSSGALRRRPGLRWDLDVEAAVRDFPELQLRILNEAAGFVRTGGGRLVYATCSLIREENEGVARAFERAPAFGESWERWDFPDSEEAEISLFGEEGRNWCTIYPEVDGPDGFFIARWRRR